MSLVVRSVSGGTWLSVLNWHSGAEHGIPAMAAAKNDDSEIRKRLVSFNTCVPQPVVPHLDGSILVASHGVVGVQAEAVHGGVVALQVLVPGEILFK